MEEFAVKVPDASSNFVRKIHMVIHPTSLHITIRVQIHLRIIKVDGRLRVIQAREPKLRSEQRAPRFHALGATFYLSRSGHEWWFGIELECLR